MTTHTMSNLKIQRDNTVEEQLHQLLLSKKEQLQNKPDLILKTIDDFGAKNKLTNIGPFKGSLLKHELQSTNPITVVEFGTYVGYSSILIASVLKNLSNDEESKVYTFEVDPVLAKISHDIIELSGLSQWIVQITGKVSDKAEALIDEYNIEQIDFLFLDHYKYFYLPDLRVVESLGLISPGSTLFADGVPGAPDYLQYIKAPPIFKRDHNATVKNINGVHFCGRWGILYETYTILTQNGSSRNADGVEITKCAQLLG